MPQFDPGVLKTARAPITVKPSGLSCQAELYLVSDATKVATSGLKPFTSTGAAQDITFPITMPSAPGNYPVWLDIFVSGTLIGAYMATEDVTIAAPITKCSAEVVGAPTTLISLFGGVTDEESGKDIVGVKVSISNLFTYTSSLGCYLVANIYEPLTPGSYTVTFEKPGYETVVRSVVLVAYRNELSVQMLVSPIIALTVLVPEDVAFKDYETYKLNDWYIMVGNDRWFVGQVGRYVRRGGGGARFQGVPIPRGKTIKTARLHFISATDNTKTVLRSRIRGVAADSTTPFSTMEDYNSKLANTTSAVVTWDNVPGVDYFVSLVSPEIKSIIQEIVNRPGWQYGNNLTLFWEDHEGRSDDARRVVYAFQPTYAPILEVELG